MFTTHAHLRERTENAWSQQEEERLQENMKAGLKISEPLKQLLHDGWKVPTRLRRKKRHESCDNTLSRIIQSSVHAQEEMDEKSQSWDQEKAIEIRSERNEEERKSEGERGKGTLEKKTHYVLMLPARPKDDNPPPSPKRSVYKLERRKSISSVADLFSSSLDLRHWQDADDRKFAPSSREFDAGNLLWMRVIFLSELAHRKDIEGWDATSQCDTNRQMKYTQIHKMASLRILADRHKNKKEGGNVAEEEDAKAERDGRIARLVHALTPRHNTHTTQPSTDNNNGIHSKDSSPPPALNKEESFSEGLSGLSQVFGPARDEVRRRNSEHSPPRMLVSEESFSEGLDGFSAIFDRPIRKQENGSAISQKEKDGPRIIAGKKQAASVDRKKQRKLLIPSLDRKKPEAQDL